jgi:prepilin peptidase CpaA
MPQTAVIAVVSICLAASVTDVRSRRIPNELTLGAAGAAFAYHAMIGGWAAAGSAGLGWLVGMALFLPFFLLRGMGGGDVKLLAAVGAWLGPRDVVYVGLYTMMAGGVLALIVALAKGYLPTLARNVWNLVWQWCLTGIRPVPTLTLDHKGGGPRLAYALPIFAGTAVTLWIR